MVDNGHLATEQADAEVDYLLNLLGDYSEKIRARLDSAEQARMTRYSWLLMSIALASVAFMVVFRLIREIDLFFSYVAAGLVVITPLFVMWVLRSEQSITRQQREVQRLTEVLNLLIRRASQIEDHGKANMAQRVILDIRLAEAEAALTDVSRAVRFDKAKPSATYTEFNPRERVVTGTLE